MPRHLLAAALLLTPTLALADVTLPSLFTDGAVLQRDRPVPVWGRAEPGERVIVSFRGQRVSARADRDGRFRIELKPMRAQGEPAVLKVEARSGKPVKVRDVVVGEVWICSGQSNMSWTVAASRDAAKEIAAADHPSVRLLTVQRLTSKTPLDDFKGHWARCAPETVRSFSAVAYFFGRELAADLDVPIGLVHSSWGGTPAESWTARSALEGEKALAPLLERRRKLVEAYDPEAAKKEYAAALEKWKQAADKARAEGGRAPRKPRAPLDPARSPHHPSVLWNGMIEPLLPYAVRGAIWYQGESNASRAAEYRTLFPLMIRDWRRAFGDEELPFYFVQLANFTAARPEPGESRWAELRDAQLMTLRTVPHTGMAVTIDIGEASDIHPKNKQDVGKRLANWALAKTYGRNAECSGPLYRSHERRGRESVLRFDHADGLKARGDLRGFAIAGEDGKYVWADARIEGETVIVGNKDIAHPASVRYAWADNPPSPLENAAGLPASPFQTDGKWGQTPFPEGRESRD